MSERKRKIAAMQAVVDRYPNVTTQETPSQTTQSTESIWDTIKRTKSNLIDKPLENLSIKQKTQARKWKKYHDEMKDILSQ